MKFTTTWLSRYVPKSLTTTELADACERAGIEVDALIQAPVLDANIVVGRVEELTKHPEADKLKVAKVEVGRDEPWQIVCGAPNIATGQIVAVALPGAVLPDGTKIGKAKLRGVTSNGMICSQQELGMGGDHSGIMVLPPAYQVGKSLCDIVNLTDILDVKTAANRSDLTSYLGIAREIASQTGARASQPSQGKLPSMSARSLVGTVDTDLSPYYSLVKLDVRAAKTDPEACAELLTQAGHKTLMPAVDITNFVLWETGQPLHAFDADTLALPLDVRAARSGEKLQTLDGVTRKLTTSDIVIADQNGPVALAGVMGGAATQVTAETTTVLLEAANFDGARIRKTALRHGLRTEASARYERGLPVRLVETGLARALYLYEQAGARFLSGQQRGIMPALPAPIAVKPESISSLLGFKVSKGDVKSLLPRLGIQVKGRTRLQAYPPFWRPDITTWADLAEELVKLKGYEAVPTTLPVWQPQEVRINRDLAATRRLRHLAKAAGLFEVATYSFVSERQLTDFDFSLAGHLKLKNPLSEEQAYLRSSLLPSLIDVIARNQRYREQFGVFEVSRVFVPKAAGELPNEPRMAAVALAGSYSDAKRVLDLFNNELHLNLSVRRASNPRFLPGRQAEVMAGNSAIGFIGEVDTARLPALKLTTPVAYLELSLEAVLPRVGQSHYEPVSRFPSVNRDVAVVVDRSCLWSDIAALVEQTLQLKPEYLSQYQGKGIPEGKKSVAFRLGLTAPDRTLTDEEANARIAELETALHDGLDATIRS